jgi:hypothetical protein
VTAIGLGPRVYDNLRKAMGFIFAVHAPIAGMALLPLVLGLPIFPREKQLLRHFVAVTSAGIPHCMQ